MATISVTVTATLASDLQAVLQRLYGSAVEGMTVRQMVVFHLKTTLRPHLVALRQGRIDNTALEAARVAAEQTAAVALDTYNQAIQQAATDADAALEGVT